MVESNLPRQSSSANVGTGGSHIFIVTKNAPPIIIEYPMQILKNLNLAMKFNKTKKSNIYILFMSLHRILGNQI